ncbi:hypothetical protein LINPERPRIM_LOCUS25272 [Linum perenne]
MTSIKVSKILVLVSFKALNLTLLAKQSWHIVTNLGSLTARILKGKYFSRPFFLKAELGSRLSWFMRSLMHGRCLFSKPIISDFDMYSNPWVSSPNPSPPEVRFDVV